MLLARSRPAKILHATVTAGLVAGTLALTRAARGIPTSIGAGRRRIAPVAARSTSYDGRVFANRLPSAMLAPGTGGATLRGFLTRGRRGRPSRPVPLATPDIPSTAADLAVTWLGHATVLIELDGAFVLADPVWGERVSPSELVGPARTHPVPLELDELPKLAAVLISHDHYDHLDLPTITALVKTQTAPFVVPLGVGAHLRGWGVPEERIVELDWDERTEASGITLTCTEARHFSGRGFTRNLTLWSSWALTGPRSGGQPGHAVFFGGDTGYTPAFEGIGAQYGPFDLALLPIGAYNDAWPDIHMNPEEAWHACGDLGARAMVPIHWATFDLALHSWAEPVERLLQAAGSSPAVLVPRPGERIDPRQHGSVTPWWRDVQ